MNQLRMWSEEPAHLRLKIELYNSDRENEMNFEKQYFQSIQTPHLSQPNFAFCCRHTAFCRCTLSSTGMAKQSRGKEMKVRRSFWKCLFLLFPPTFFSLCCIFTEEYETQQTTAVSTQSKQITQSVLIVTRWWWMMMCPENTVRNVLCYSKHCSCKLF